jgi:hypothetical protein
MCNSYSLTKGQAAIIAFVRAMRDRTGKPRVSFLIFSHGSRAMRPMAFAS